MRVYVVGSSSLHLWRRDIRGESILKKEVFDALTDCPTSPKELASLRFSDFEFGNAPVRLMVPSKELRISRRLYSYSVQPHALPENAFHQLTDHICIASPELCLLESANKLSLLRLIELCMELCGKYALVPETQRGYISRNYQLASTESIDRFLRGISHIHGVKKLRRAVQFVCDGSRSPMETREYLLTCLPKRLGGYGLPPATLNARINLNSAERRVAKRQYLECDECWPDQQVIVEYDGHDDHESRENRARDAAKRNILISRGYDVFTVTGKQICDVHAFDKVIRDISCRIGFRLKDFPTDWEQRHSILRQELFMSLSKYESERFMQTHPHLLEENEMAKITMVDEHVHRAYY